MSQGFPIPLQVELLKAPEKQTVVLLSDFSYIDSLDITHTAEAGFRFNGGSIPRFFWRICPPWTGLARYAYPIHDWECDKANKELNPDVARHLRGQADLTFKEMLTFLGEPSWKVRMMYRGVRIGAFHGGLA